MLTFLPKLLLLNMYRMSSHYGIGVCCGSEVTGMGQQAAALKTQRHWQENVSIE
jgi:hypothetical protein